MEEKWKCALENWECQLCLREHNMAFGKRAWKHDVDQSFCWTLEVLVELKIVSYMEGK